MSPSQEIPANGLRLTKFDYRVFTVVAVIVAARLMIDQSYWFQQHALRFALTCIITGIGICLARRAV